MLKVGTKKKGFSLLEVLVTMAIASAMFYFIFDTFTTSRKLNDRIEKGLELRNEMRIIKNLIESDLNSIVFLRNYTNDFEGIDIQANVSGIKGINIVNGQDAVNQIYMHVNRPAINHFNVGLHEDPEIHEVGYFIAVKDPEKPIYALFRREQFYLDKEFDFYVNTPSINGLIKDERTINLVLTENIKGLNFKYLRPTAPNTPEVWLDEWESMDNINEPNYSDSNNFRRRIPIAIEVTIILENETGIRLEESFQVNMRPPLGDNINFEFSY